jgi:hypothetical protein
MEEFRWIMACYELVSAALEDQKTGGTSEIPTNFGVEIQVSHWIRFLHAVVSAASEYQEVGNTGEI